MMYEFGELFSLYQLVRDSKVLVGGSCSRINALHNRLDCLIIVKDNLSFIQRKNSESPNRAAFYMCGYYLWSEVS